MGRRSKRKSFTRRAGRFLMWAALVAVLVPVCMTVAYRFVPPPATPLMLIRAVQGHGIRKIWVPLSRVSPYVVSAVLALEDTRFCSHSGFDWDEVADAVGEHLDGGRLRGASTVSMQTAKNVFLWPGRNVVRKIVEVPLTVLVEAVWGKRRIMEVYLNVAEWGPGIYGIEAASRAHFGKPASALSRREAALLAAVLPNPRRWSPARPTLYIRGRASTALARAYTVSTRCTRK